MKTVLVVDDNINITALLREYLSEHNFRVVLADNGVSALYQARHECPDLILLDIMMPKMDGYEFINNYRKEADTPIILLTAKIAETDKVVGLELGADDYITKPFGMAELTARIKAVLRRYEKPVLEESILRVAELELHPKQHLLKFNGQNLELTPSEFALLKLFMKHPRKVFSRLDLLEHLQDESLKGSERIIDVHIANLRKKLKEQPKDPKYIETVFGLGYRFCAKEV